MEQSQEYLKREFMHVLSDALALLGADEELVIKMQSIEEKPFTPEIIEYLRKFTYNELTKVKTRLYLCHSTPVMPS